MQTVWLIESVVEERQAAIRRQVAECRRRGSRPVAGVTGPRTPWRVRLGWRLVEIGLRLALPGQPSAAGALRGPGAH